MRRCYEARQQLLEARARRVRSTPSDDDGTSSERDRDAVVEGTSVHDPIVLASPPSQNGRRQPKTVMSVLEPVEFAHEKCIRSYVVMDDVCVPAGADILKCRAPWMRLILDANSLHLELVFKKTRDKSLYVPFVVVALLLIHVVLESPQVAIWPQRPGHE